MSPLFAAAIGSLTTVGAFGVLFLYAAYALGKYPEMARSTSAGLLRLLSNASGFKSFMLIRGSDSLVIAFEDVAQAIDRGDLHTHVPVRVARAGESSRPPPSEGYDGRA